jgi:hypothetical protein
MPPNFMPNNLRNDSLGYAVLCSDNVLRRAARRIERAYLGNLFKRQFVQRVTLAADATALVDHVLGVLGWCAGEQMRGIAARLVVAGVASKLVRAERSNGKFKAVAMGGHRLPVDLDLAVTSNAYVANPRPASIRAGAGIYLRPETLFRGCVLTSSAVPTLEPHRLSFNPTMTGGCVQGGISRLAAAALTQLRGLLYTAHVNAPCRVLANPRPVDAGAGAFVA